MNNLIGGYWLGIRDGDPRAKALQRRHYSAHHYKDGRRIWKIIGPGEYMLLLTQDCRALFGWHYTDRPRMDAQLGVSCTIFRNEGDILSSLLIREADELAFLRWPGQRHYTYVDDKKIASKLAGACFLMAGWKYLRKHGHRVRSKSGKLILELRTGANTRQED